MLFFLYTIAISIYICVTSVERHPFSWLAEQRSNEGHVLDPNEH